tara:strand:+ start:2293 stop:2853 length:561 start_codon:yes stop_codon:yes gene_type:complete
MKQENKKIKLHLGCGKRDFGPNWIHVDGSSYPHIEHHDIVNLNFSLNEVDLIYASHVLEYFDREEVREVLKNWRAVLKQNGVLRLAVPDFEACANLYINHRVPLSKYVGMFYGKWKMSEDKIIYHKTIYDYVSLKRVLEDSGFRNVRKWEWKEVEHKNVDDFSQAYLPYMDKENGVLVSLNVECDK